jgi:excinuclease ABC subunit A
LQSLKESGNTIIIIEHNLDVIKSADWIIDLGPEGGDGGGRIIAEGPPEEVSRVKGSHTGVFLKAALARKKRA